MKRKRKKLMMGEVYWGEGRLWGWVKVGRGGGRKVVEVYKWVNRIVGVS